jgi:hypothetical protein
LHMIFLFLHVYHLYIPLFFDASYHEIRSPFPFNNWPQHVLNQMELPYSKRFLKV